MGGGAAGSGAGATGIGGGATLAIVNREPTELDPYADLVLHDEIGPVMTEAAPAN